MKAALCLLITLTALAHADENSDRDAIRKLLTDFNDQHGRATLLAPGADLAPLDRFSGPGLSQLYFASRSIQFLTPDIAFVDATASQFGTTIMKRSMPAFFVVRRIKDEWRVAILRIVAPPPIGLMPVTSNQEP